MNRLPHVVLGALVATLAACKPASTTQTPTVATPPATPTLAATADEVLARWLVARPDIATSLGEHAHDDKWPDLRPPGLATDRKRVDESLQSLAKLPTDKLAPDDRLDLEVLRAELELQKFVHDVEQPFRRDPMWYATMIGAGLEDLVSRDYAPLEQRAGSVAARLEALPTLVDQAIVNLAPGETSEPHATVAVTQLDGIVTLVEEVMPQRIAEAPEAVRARVVAATPAAVAALRRLQARIKDELLPKARGTWRLGKENFERKLALTLQSGIPAEELRRVAEAEHARVRKQMAELAFDLAPELMSPQQVTRVKARAQGDHETAIARAVLDELAAAHVAAPQLRDAVEAKLQFLDAFVREKKLVTTDPAEVLQVIWTPPHQRGVFIAGLAAPGPLEPRGAGLPSFYLVQPVPEAWSDEQRESFLREYNDFMLEILSIHEAIPGYFVQLYFAKREPSKVRRALANGPFVEGWAVYAEKAMVDAGYAGPGPGDGAKKPRGVDKKLWRVMNDPTLRAKAIALHGLKFYLRTVTNAILDHAVHAGEMSEAEAIDLMVGKSFQQEGEARGKWVRAQVTSTQLSTYFVGAQARLRLRKHAENRARDANQPFDAADAFHDAALSHGAPPVHRLPELMGWGAAAPAKPAASAAPATPAAGGH